MFDVQECRKNKFGVFCVKERAKPVISLPNGSLTSEFSPVETVYAGTSLNVGADGLLMCSWRLDEVLLHTYAADNGLLFSNWR